MSDYNVYQGSSVPIKAWTKGVQVESEALTQLKNVASLPFIHKHIAVMPDCLSSDTEALTPSGWRLISDLRVGDLVANVYPLTKEMEFLPVSGVVERHLRPGEKVYSFEYGFSSSQKREIIVTENHRMGWMNNPGDLAKNLPETSMLMDYMWFCVGIKEEWGPSQDLSVDEICLLAWIVGDGNIKTTHNAKSTNRRIRFGFKKERKILRLKELLSRLDLEYSEFVSFKQTEIYINTKSSSKYLDIVGESKTYPWYLLGMGKKKAEAFLLESVQVNGDYEIFLKNGSMRFNSSVKEEVGFFSAIAAVYGFGSSTTSRVVEGFTGKVESHYTGLIASDRFVHCRSGLHARKVKRNTVPYTGTVVCLSCPTTFFLARRDGVPFVTGNCHYGRGATVGSVIPTKGAIIPAAVGVDLSCGMVAVRTGLVSHDLPTSLKPWRNAIEKAIPVGAVKGASHDKGGYAQDDVPKNNARLWKNKLEKSYATIHSKHPLILHKKAASQLGTLGSGNHFIEICLDETDRVWLMLHSGSRGPGNSIGRYFTELAKEDMRKYFINLPDKDLAYFPEGTEYFNDYIEAMEWAGNFAFYNRNLMVENVFEALNREGGVPHKKLMTHDIAVNVHHNFTRKESHYGENVWLTRKGAVCARKGVMSIIPGSMGAKSFIVEGKGNPESFHSCSHGAGRVMSRSKAKKTFTLDDHIEATSGVECRKDEGVIDETPRAYKDIDAVMAAQASLVDIKHTLKQILCIKG